MSVGERDLVSRLLKHSILTLCREAVTFNTELDVDGLVCLTVDNQSQHIVKIHELFRKESNVTACSSTRDSNVTSGITSAVRTEQTPTVHHGNVHARLSFNSVDSSISRSAERDRMSASAGRNSATSGSNSASRGGVTNNDGIRDTVKVEPPDSNIPDRKAEPDVQIEPRSSTASETDVIGTGLCDMIKMEPGDVIMTEPEETYVANGTTAVAGTSNGSNNSNTNDNNTGSKSSTFLETLNIKSQKVTLSKARNIQCKKCDAVLADGAALERHYMQAHGHFTCLICLATFTSRNNMKRHVRLHTGIKPYSCHKCAESFARNDDYKRHLLRHTFQKPFRCAICKTGYSDRSCVKNHMIKEHQSKLFHICPQCGESFIDAQRFQQHKKTHPEFQDYRCTLCSFTGSNALMYNKHMLTHGPPKIYRCTHCNLQFKEPFAYTNHLKKHKGNDMVQAFGCCFCDMQLQSYEQFQRHEHSHIQAKQHSCDICKKLFRYPSNLREHMLTHMSKDINQNIALNEHDSNETMTTDATASTSAIMNEPKVINVDMEEENNNNTVIGKNVKTETVSDSNSCNESNDYWCTECNQGFGTEDQLTQHINKTHEQPELSSEARKGSDANIRDKLDAPAAHGPHTASSLVSKTQTQDSSYSSQQENSRGFRVPHKIRIKSGHVDYKATTMMDMPRPKRARVFDEDTVIDDDRYVRVIRNDSLDDASRVSAFDRETVVDIKDDYQKDVLMGANERDRFKSPAGRSALFDQETVVDTKDDYQKDLLMGHGDRSKYKSPIGRASVLFDQDTVVDRREEYQKHVEAGRKIDLTRSTYASYARAFDEETVVDGKDTVQNILDRSHSDKRKRGVSSLFGNVFEEDTVLDKSTDNVDVIKPVIKNHAPRVDNVLNTKGQDKSKHASRHDGHEFNDMLKGVSATAGTNRSNVPKQQNKNWRVPNKHEHFATISSSSQLKKSLNVDVKSEPLDQSYTTLVEALGAGSPRGKTQTVNGTALGSNDGDMPVKVESQDRDSLSPTCQYSKTSVLGMDTEFSSAPNRSSPTTLNLKVRNPGFEKVVTPEILFSTKSPFTCEVCEETFLDFDSFDQHGVTIHRRYICSYCGKAFTSRPNRERHIRYHTGEKPYKCDLCPVSFFRGDDLKYHRTTKHADVRPFTCGMCNMSFGMAKELEKHLRIHPEHRS